MFSLSFSIIVFFSLSPDTNTYQEEVTTMTKLPVIAKGILSCEDATEAVNHGAAGIIVCIAFLHFYVTTTSPHLQT